MWYERNKSLEAEGKVKTLGLIQEQHPDRCRLFMQWKQMDFPILVDSLNLLDVAVVPMMVLIDEAGVVQAIRPDEKALAEFVAAPPAAVPLVPPPSGARNVFDMANRLILFGQPDGLDRAINMYEQQCSDVPEDSRAQFRLGVSYRRRFDNPETRRSGDFAKSIEHWERALALNPNQYIWRRRIQQYGPRLDKPYPFYDWVSEAQRDIKARGEEPVPLAVALSGAEVAMPERGGGDTGEASTAAQVEPDPADQIDHDVDSLFLIESVVVHDTGKGQRAARVHVLLTPSREAGAKWNDEAGPSVVWIDPPQGWRVDRRLLTLEAPADGSLTEPRSVEFEVRPIAPSEESGRAELSDSPLVRGYVLFNVCYGTEGICTYLRRGFQIRVQWAE